MWKAHGMKLRQINNVEKRFSMPFRKWLSTSHRVVLTIPHLGDHTLKILDRLFKLLINDIYLPWQNPRSKRVAMDFRWTFRWTFSIIIYLCSQSSIIKPIAIIYGHSDEFPYLQKLFYCSYSQTCLVSSHILLSIYPFLNVLIFFFISRFIFIWTERLYSNLDSWYLAPSSTSLSMALWSMPTLRWVRLGLCLRLILKLSSSTLISPASSLFLVLLSVFLIPSVSHLY